MDTDNNLIWVDAEGRKWSTRLEIPHAIALKNRGFDVGNTRSLGRTLGDPEKLLEFAVEFFRPQWERHADVIPDEVAFMVILTATQTSLVDAHAAITRGLIDFFLRKGDRRAAAVVERVVAANKATDDALVAKIATPGKVDETIDRAIETAKQAFDDELDRVAANFGTTFSSDAASSGSDPTG